MPSVNRTVVNQRLTMGLLAANDDEDTILVDQFYSRYIDLIVNDTIVNSTGWVSVINHEGRQVWVDEIFDSKQNQSHDGLYLYAQNGAAQDLSTQLVARIHVEYELEQRYWPDSYTRKGKHHNDGWNGYEWEESGYYELCDTSPEGDGE